MYIFKDSFSALNAQKCDPLGRVDVRTGTPEGKYLPDQKDDALGTGKGSVEPFVVEHHVAAVAQRQGHNPVLTALRLVDGQAVSQVYEMLDMIELVPNEELTRIEHEELLIFVINLHNKANGTIEYTLLSVVAYVTLQNVRVIPRSPTWT